MKEFKIDLSGYEGKVREVVSEAVQRHAFKLGYPGWLCDGMQPKYTMCPFLYIENDRMLRDDEAVHRDTFNRCKNILISAAAFLALTPEDVKDEVIVTTEPADWLLVTEGESQRLVPIGSTIRNTGSEPLNIEFFTRTVAERFLPKEGK